MTASPPRLDLPLLNAGHGTAWSNLGDWTTATRYVDAARDLALRLGTVAELGPGHTVLDVGVGGGSQVLLWFERFGVGRVTAVENEPAAVAALQDRLAPLGSAVRIEEADAARLPPAAAPSGAHDRVLALDCAYHLHPRRAFLKKAAGTLKPGGRLAVTDLLTRGSGPPATAEALAGLSGIPRENLVDEKAYRADLEALGFVDVRVEDIGAAVLGGFSSWARRNRWSLARRSPLGGWPTVALTGLIAGAAYRRGWLTYAVVTARRPA